MVRTLLFYPYLLFQKITEQNIRQQKIPAQFIADAGISIGLHLSYILTLFSLKWYSGHAAFSNWSRREVAVCPFCSMFWVEFWRILFPEKFWWSQKSAVKKAVVTKNTVSCNSRCFWVSRRLVSFLESSEQISRFGTAFKKPPPKRRFLVHQQGLEPGTRWLRVSCSTNWAIGAHITL